MRKIRSSGQSPRRPETVRMRAGKLLLCVLLPLLSLTLVVEYSDQERHVKIELTSSLKLLVTNLLN